MRRHTVGRAARGFTLIELLTVIAIIAILSSILFPVFLKAREKAEQTQCLSNLRQIGLALKMYSDDWERLPHAAAQPSTEPQLPRLIDVLYPYHKSESLWQCPGDSDEVWPVEGSSYGWVELFNGKRPTRAFFMGTDLTKLPCLADAKVWHQGGTDNGGKCALWLDGHVKFVAIP